ncbi:MAG: alpha/beta hydrolase [Melioribacteraceae bacterium]|nr:alpha/beta hydrolase [Melioribacteraceae bacterium]
MEDYIKNYQFLDVDGKIVAYQRAGEGETLLLVHGITTYSFIWRFIKPILAKKYDVIAVDLLGAGSSDKTLDVEYSIKTQAKFLYDFAKKLNIEKLHYVGHDVGGGVGQLFAVIYPEITKSLTLINSVAYDFWPVQPIIAMRTPIIRQLMMASLDVGTFKMIIKRGVFDKSKITEEVMKFYFYPLKSKEGRKSFLHFARSLDNNDLLSITEQLRKLKCPVMIIRGNNDVYLSKAISEKLHNEIKGSLLKIVDEAGHFIQEEKSELLAQHIEEFCNDR